MIADQIVMGLTREAMLCLNQERQQLEIDRQRAKAYYLGYSSIEKMEDHLPWLETRFPEGAEL